MSFNRGDVRSDVRRRLEEFNTTVFTEADFEQEFEYALTDLTNRVDFKELEVKDLTSLDTVVDQQEYTLPTTSGVVRKMIDVVTDNVHYEEVDFLDRDNVSSASGVSLGDVRRGANAYYLYGSDTIGLIPIPSTVTDIELYYYRKHATISDDTTILSLPDIARKALVTRITATGMKADETIPNAFIQTEMNEYERFLSEMRQVLEETSRLKVHQFTRY